MKNKNNSKFRKLLFASSLVLWMLVFLASFFVLKTGGHLLPLAAQPEKPSTKYTVEGKILGLDGVGVRDARVIIFENGLKHTYISDPYGHYIMYNLEGGSYKINVEAPGYKGFSNTILVDGRLAPVQNFYLSR